MKQLALILSAAILLSSAEAKAQSDMKVKFDIVKIKAHVDAANKVYGDRFQKNDIAIYNERYCADAEILPAENPTIKGREGIMNYYYNEGKNTGLAIVITTTNLYGSDYMVVEEGLYDFPDGKGGSFDKGKFIALWKQEDGTWKLFREIWNRDTPTVSN